MCTTVQPRHLPTPANISEVGNSFDRDIVRCQEIYPVEIWKLVSEKLSKNCSTDDILESFSNASPFFQNLIAGQRSLFLFEKAINIVTETIWNQEGIQGLSIVELLNLRQTCSTWCKVIYKLIWEKFQGRNNLPNDVSEALQSVVMNEFGDPREKIFQFLEHFEDTHSCHQPGISSKNPLIFPNLDIITKNEGENEEDDEVDIAYLEALSKLFSIYEHHFQNLQVYFRGDTVFLVETEKLREWLENAPNLKTLEIHNETEWMDSDINEYEAQIRESPFPKLSFLEKLTTNRLPGTLFSQIISQNNHVSELTHIQTGQIDEFFTFPAILPNMTYLEMNNVQTLGTLGQLHESFFPKLETLKVSCWYITDKLKWSHVFQMIQQNFAKTLVHLSLQLPQMLLNENINEECWQTSKTFRFNLPFLKVVHLTLRDPASLDFLLPMKDTLETLKLDFMYLKHRKSESRGDCDTNVKYVGLEENILESNIPRLFTSLKKIGVCIGTTSRKWYERKEWDKFKQ